MLKEFPECYIDFRDAPLKKFVLEYWELQTNFITIDQRLWNSELLLINIIKTPQSF